MFFLCLISFLESVFQSTTQEYLARTDTGRDLFRNTFFHDDRISEQQNLSSYFMICSIYWLARQCFFILEWFASTWSFYLSSANSAETDVHPSQIPPIFLQVIRLVSEIYVTINRSVLTAQVITNKIKIPVNAWLSGAIFCST